MRTFSEIVDGMAPSARELGQFLEDTRGLLSDKRTAKEVLFDQIIRLDREIFAHERELISAAVLFEELDVHRPAQAGEPDSSAPCGAPDESPPDGFWAGNMMRAANATGDTMGDTSDGLDRLFREAARRPLNVKPRI